MDKQILLVDDEPNILFTLQLCLEAEGYEVITATDGVEAVDQAFAHQPDLILLDVRLPKLNGHMVCKALKEDSRTKEIPIVFVSAKAEEEDLQKGKELGAVDYLVKPVEPDELLKMVSKHL